MAKLKINGQEKNFDRACFPDTVSKLLANMKIAEETVVAEVDGKIVERDKFNEHKLEPNANIELIRFVGGG